MTLTAAEQERRKHNKQSKKYALTHKEQIQKYKKLYRIKNKKRLKAKSKKYYQDHKQQILSRIKRHAAKNKKRIKLYKQNYQIQNKLRIRRYKKRYYLEKKLRQENQSLKNKVAKINIELTQIRKAHENIKIDSSLKQVSDNSATTDVKPQQWLEFGIG
jgi:hypothetical protein